MRRLALLLAVMAVPVVIWAALPVFSTAKPSLHQRIETKRQAIEQRKAKEGVLSTTISSYSQRIRRLQGDIGELQRRQIKIQTALDSERAELAAIQAKLRAERARLARLRARLAEARAALAKRLQELYKADKPDVVTVVLESEGFADLLERTEFMQRVSDQDTRIIDTVRAAKADATKTAARLDTLEGRQQKVAAAILARRDEVAAVRGQLVDRRDSYASVRSRKQTALASVREDRHHIEGELHILEKEEQRIQAKLAQASGALPAGPIRHGSGSLIFPVNGPIVSPFGQRWGRLHAGVDIAAPTGTPIRAADGGRVAIAGWVSGYGNYTCIQHNSSLSTCYGHQTSFATSVGATVSKGQVIGYVGCTGHCFGPHVHFETRVGGAPVDPMGYL
ncbi:MAG TPA: peptidoglycan DD-metalloendopeptidase family protein [Solirubrobacteraceae bacterium]|jgi:murein DD-endopeptidase MepM/ murein hydrolase activator NlpD